MASIDRLGDFDDSPLLPHPIAMDPVGEVYASHGHCAVRLYAGGLPDDTKIYTEMQMARIVWERDAWRELYKSLSGA